MMADSILDLARKQAADRWQVPLDQVLTDDLSSAFPWATCHRLLGVSDGEDRYRLFAEHVASGTWLTFDPPNNLVELNRFFEVEDIAFPDGLAPEVLAQALRAMLSGFRGAVGSPAFLEGELQRLGRWVRRRGDEAIFEQHCSAPRIEGDAAGWTLGFSFFTPRGGVERWSVEGDEKHVLDVRWEDALPPDTFKFPYV